MDNSTTPTSTECGLICWCDKCPTFVPLTAQVIFPECGVTCWCDGPCEFTTDPHPPCGEICWCDGSSCNMIPIEIPAPEIPQHPSPSQHPVTSLDAAGGIPDSEAPACDLVSNADLPPTLPTHSANTHSQPASPPAQDQILQYRKRQSNKYKSVTKKTSNPPPLMALEPNVELVDVILGDSNLSRSSAIISNRASKLWVKPTSGGTVHTMLEEVKSLPPCNHLMLQGGTNDGMRTNDITRIVPDLVRVIREAKTKSKKVTLVAPPPTSNVMVDMEHLMQAVARNNKINFVPVHHLFPSTDRKLYRERDRLHPSHRGSGLYGLAIIEYLKRSPNMIDSVRDTSCIACHRAGHSITTCRVNMRPNTSVPPPAL